MLFQLFHHPCIMMTYLVTASYSNLCHRYHKKFGMISFSRQMSIFVRTRDPRWRRCIYLFFCMEKSRQMACPNGLLPLTLLYLHLHEIVEGLYFYFSLSVCVCVPVNKMPAERINQFGCGFR